MYCNTTNKPPLTQSIQNKLSQSIHNDEATVSKSKQSDILINKSESNELSTTDSFKYLCITNLISNVDLIENILNHCYDIFYDVF